MNDYSPIFQKGADETEYVSLGSDGLAVERLGAREFLTVAPQALSALAERAFADLAHRFRPSHLQQLRSILEDPEASDNDREVAQSLLKNAVIASAGVLPSCQDTGTALVIGEKGQQVLTEGDDAEAFSAGIARTYAERNLRFSQLAPQSMFEEQNTGTNLPAQIDIAAVAGDSYDLLFVAKGGGSANKTFLFQQTKALLNPEKLHAFLEEKVASLGTAACPPYHLAIVIGGLSAEQTLKTVKLASCRALDGLPTTGDATGRAFRDRELEGQVLEMTRHLGIGAQFGGKYFCHDVRVIRLPRHAGSLPVGLGVSCSADRQVKAKITADGIFLEKLEAHPERYLPELSEGAGTAPLTLDLNQPMDEIRRTLSGQPVGTKLSLTGPLIVARDVVHAELLERLQAGEDLPDYVKDHPIYYAGPAKTPEGMASGSFGPTTSARMDPYAAPFMAAGGSLVTLGKGNRSPEVRQACADHGGFYLGTVGGAAAAIAQDHIRKVETLDFAELGMEAVWRIEVQDMPAFLVIDDQGNDFYAR
ncbi:FumA C-terminus/TtdB family hydratase beta subunit [Fodinicurvata halophila]|uniref:Fumarate hydratase class I n=1 Tax=Fodinicurvata halophila TaxID=1419723 RepID=A0ABV8UP82_9PROT